MSYRIYYQINLVGIYIFILFYIGYVIGHNKDFRKLADKTLYFVNEYNSDHIKIG